MKTNLKILVRDFLSILFPDLCILCHEILIKGEEEICYLCKEKLPKTNHHLNITNELQQRFWGIIPIKASFAYYTFKKGSNVQRLLYFIKYKDRKDLAYSIGSSYGRELKQAGKTFHMIIPVPLHKKKKQKRGYNQSECFGNGLAEALEIPCLDIIRREKNNPTQTNKTRHERWQNVKDNFVVNENADLYNKDILLVDDVITTGATVAACAESLMLFQPKSISVVAIAFAH